MSTSFRPWTAKPALAATLCIAGILTACSADPKPPAAASSKQDPVVSVTEVSRRALQRTLTLSSELVPFQEIDVYAKESGYIQKLLVDYGSRVKAGQLMAVLEIPELEALLRQDNAEIENAKDLLAYANQDLARVDAQYRVLHLEFTRLDTVAKTRPGLVAQQEVDDAQSKDLASAAQVQAARSSLLSAQSRLTAAQAKLERDRALYAYSRITAPFDGVVTKRYANLGALMQAGTTSSTQAMPLVQLSQDNLFRLVIPVPESYVRYIRIGDAVKVQVPALNRSFPGKVARFSVDVREDTRTMHTEVDVPNPDHILIPGVYAEAVLTLERKAHALSIPLQAIDHAGTSNSVYLVGPDRRLEKREISLGLQTASDAEVVSGLRNGDMVITSDRSGLEPGDVVQPRLAEVMTFQEKK